MSIDRMRHSALLEIEALRRERKAALLARLAATLKADPELSVKQLAARFDLNEGTVRNYLRKIGVRR